MKPKGRFKIYPTDMALSPYQLLVLLNLLFMNFVCAGLLVYGAYSIIRFPALRKAVAEAIQNGDKVFHWIDARNFSYLLAGFLAGWFTMNIAGILMYEKMFDYGPMVFLGIFISVTFALMGIAWKNSSYQQHPHG